MNRNLHNAMMAQYATPEITGNGLVSWEDGKKCVIPSVKLYGAAVQDGTPTPDTPIMPVCNNGVFKAMGRNIADLYGYSANGIETPSASRSLTNQYGTTISTTAPEKSVQAIQSKINNTSIPVSYTNGYFCIGIGHGLKNGDIVTLSCDLEIIDNPLGAKQLTYLANGSGGFYYSALSNGRQSVTMTWANNGEKKFIEVRLSGCSVIFSNFQIELSSTTTPYTPYYDGGQAQAPDLWAIPGTGYRDEWDCQTGRGIRRCAVIDSYAGEDIDTPYISSTGELTEGAMIVYGIPDTPFTATPARLTQPSGFGQIIQISGDVADCPISAKYLTHR